MYIWILLATIMVAFSFYNVAPRADKEHALNEVKAATVVNRFKAEHSSRLHMIECEIIYNKSSQPAAGGSGWDGETDGVRKSASGAVDITSYVPPYTTLKANLPVGYLPGRKFGVDDAVKHFVYCLSQDAESTSSSNVEENAIPKPDSEVFIACNAQNDARTKDIGDHRYLVSFAQIPDRWLSKPMKKNPDDINSPAVVTPLPTFVNQLAKVADKSAVFGWLEYDGGWKLHGLGASASRTIKLKDKDRTFDDNHKDQFEQRWDDNFVYNGTGSTQYGHEKLVADKIILAGDSPLWRNTVLDEKCKTTPCMFIYEVLPKIDYACHCYNLMQADPANRLNLAKCYNDEQHNEIADNAGITKDGKTTLNDFTSETYKQRELRYLKFKDQLIKPKQENADDNTE